MNNGFPDSLASRMVEDYAVQAVSLIEKWYDETPDTLDPDGREDAKDHIRGVHLQHRQSVLRQNRRFLEERGEALLDFLAYGDEIDPSSIEPDIRLALPSSEESDLFRLAAMWWSIPVSWGFGRRVRCVVLDKQNGKLIGVLGLGDPVFNLGPRDKEIGWKASDKCERLRHVLDAFVLGALPPYNELLCGKLIAALATSKEVESMFRKRYKGRRTVITGRKQDTRIALLTTSSVFGKSSVYSRLKLNGTVSFRYVGTTKGYGHFHVPEHVFEAMKGFLTCVGHSYASGNRFGDGPNWKLRVIRKTLHLLELDHKKLKHGISRGIYMIPISRNWKEFLVGNHSRLIKKDIQLSSDEIAEFCIKRWIVPRAERRPEFENVSGSEALVHSVNSAVGEQIFSL